MMNIFYAHAGRSVTFVSVLVCYFGSEDVSISDDGQWAGLIFMDCVE